MSFRMREQQAIVEKPRYCHDHSTTPQSYQIGGV